MTVGLDGQKRGKDAETRQNRMRVQCGRHTNQRKEQQVRQVGAVG
jgi:hypothetical protein